MRTWPRPGSGMFLSTISKFAPALGIWATFILATVVPFWLEVLTRRMHGLDVARHRLVPTCEQLDVDDALALLAGDPGPVVGVGGVRQILVLLELLTHGGQQVVGGHALGATADQPLERELLAAADDRLDHRARGEVLEVEHF